jgi:galactokinase
MNVSQLTGHFESLFGSQPAIFRAPGRVNLIGEHTDYNEGFVMPAAVAFSTYVAIAPRTDRKLIIRSEEFSGDYEFDLDNLPRQRIDSWCDYVLGVASVLEQRGYKLHGSNLLVHGEVPIGAGLSSSAAIEVASAFALMSLGEIDLPLPEVAKLCRQAENTFVGAKVGIMDQFISCMGKAGHAVLLDCRSLEVKFVPIPPDLRLVVCNTMVKHSLATGAYNTRREECEEGVRWFAKWNRNIRALRDVSPQLLADHAQDLPATIRKRCSHIVGENERALETVSVLTEGNLDRLRELMRESHVSLRDLYEVSCKELDVMVDAAQDLPGFCGGRMTGGGFGGCTINLVREQDAQRFAIEIAERYRRVTGITPQVYLCTAEAGAERIS